VYPVALALATTAFAFIFESSRTAAEEKELEGIVNNARKRAKELNELKDSPAENK